MVITTRFGGFGLLLLLATACDDGPVAAPVAPDAGGPSRDADAPSRSQDLDDDAPPTPPRADAAPPDAPEADGGGEPSGSGGSGGTFADAGSRSADDAGMTEPREPDAGAPTALDAGEPATDAGKDGDEPDLESPPGEIPEDYTTHYASGARLSVMTLSAEGTPLVFDDFFDEELGARCEFVELGGGLRCVPRPGDVGRQWRGYTDPTCTQSLYTVPPCAPAELFATGTEGACHERFVTSLVEVTGPQTLYYEQEDGGCAILDAAFDPGLPMRVEGASVDPSRFVAGEHRWLATRGQLTLAIVEAEDGAHGPHELIDIGLEAACEERFSLDTTECYPRRRAWYEGNLFADDMCSERLPVAYSATPKECDDVDYIVVPFTEQGPNLYRPGDAFDEPVWTSVGTCIPREEAPWLTDLLELGEPAAVDAGHLLGRYLGSGRLRALAVGERDTPLKLLENTLWDSETQTNCQPMQVGGVSRCVGNVAYWPNAIGQYADPACTEFLPHCDSALCERTLWVEWGEGESCSGEQSITTLRRLVGMVTDPVYERAPESGECGGPVEPRNVWTWEFADASEALVEVVRGRL